MAGRQGRHRAREPGEPLSAPDATRALLRGLIDHAALFPPASMGMDEALAEDRAARGGERAWMIGRFVCPASKLSRLRDAAGGFGGAPPLSVVLDGAGGTEADGWTGALEQDAVLVAGAQEAGAQVEAIEVRLPSPRPEPGELIAARSALAPLGAEVYLELVPGERWRDSLPAAIGAAAAIGARVKLRCGGERADAFPPVELVALVMASCRQAGVPFKATAGLHHPIRHVERGSGFHMHGFLNVLAAAALAEATGAGPPELERVLAEEDPGAFAVEPDALRVGAATAPTAAIEAARERLFVGYGSCSWREPVEDLERLGVLA